MDRVAELINERIEAEAEEQIRRGAGHVPTEEQVWPRRQRLWELWVTGAPMVQIVNQLQVSERTGWRDLAACRKVLEESTVPQIRAIQLEALSHARLIYRLAMHEVAKGSSSTAGDGERKRLPAMLARAQAALELAAELAGALDRRNVVQATVAVASPLEDYERRNGPVPEVFIPALTVTNGNGDGNGNGSPQV